MTNLKRASQQLFARPEDERFEDLDSLLAACTKRKEQGSTTWQMPEEIDPISLPWGMALSLPGFDSGIQFNDWSFSQLCQLSRVHKDTINRLSVDTATAVLRETFPGGTKPMQLLVQGDVLRSIHRASYTRLYDADLLTTVRDVAGDFAPPPPGLSGATGLYSGEQDTFAFLIDDTAWVEINGEEFAPGFFIWNSEVGRRSVGVETFWFQRVCANHIVWDATDVVTYSRKHTAGVGDAIGEIHANLQDLIRVRDTRRDAFAKTIKTAMTTKIGSDAEEVTKALAKSGISQGYIKSALNEAERAGHSFTLFGMVDSLTRITGQIQFAGDRAEQDRKIGSLLSLAS